MHELRTFNFTWDKEAKEWTKDIIDPVTNASGALDVDELAKEWGITVNTEDS